MTKKKKPSPTTKSAPELSFRMTIRKPLCLKADGTFDCLRLSGLIAAAKEGNQEAKVRVFEQYQYLWRGIIAEYRNSFEPGVIDAEDLQQEAAVALLIALRDLPQKDLAIFASFYEQTFRNQMRDLWRIHDRRIESNPERLCPLNQFNEEGEPIYQVGTEPNQEEAFLEQVFPRVRPLLEPREMKAALLHYMDGFSLRVVAKKLNCSYATVKRIFVKIQEKLSILNK